MLKRIAETLSDTLASLARVDTPGTLAAGVSTARTIERRRITYTARVSDFNLGPVYSASIVARDSREAVRLLNRRAGARPVNCGSFDGPVVSFGRVLNHGDRLNGAAFNADGIEVGRFTIERADGRKFRKGTGEGTR